MKNIVGFITRMLVRMIGKKRIIHYSFDPYELRAYNMLDYGYLNDIGWWNSFRSHKPMDKNNNALPWTTYSFIDFIEPRLSHDLSLFEFGCGNSTLFFSKRVKEITSVEHDPEWLKLVVVNKHPNSTLILADKKEDEYSASVINVNKKFDLIFIDGLFRNDCTKNSINCLSERGVIVIDDSERSDESDENYNESFELLKQQGFKRIDFWGFSPGSFYRKATSIFYKAGNCLDI